MSFIGIIGMNLRYEAEIQILTHTAVQLAGTCCCCCSFIIVVGMNIISMHQKGMHTSALPSCVEQFPPYLPLQCLFPCSDCTTNSHTAAQLVVLVLVSYCLVQMEGVSACSIKGCIRDIPNGVAFYHNTIV
jgi:hypothetical protein